MTEHERSRRDQRLEADIDSGDSTALDREKSLLEGGKRLSLNAEQWDAFMAALNAPPRRHPRLERLLTEPSLLD